MRVIALLFLCLWVNYAFCEKRTHLNDLNLNGKVKVLKDYSYYAAEQEGTIIKQRKGRPGDQYDDPDKIMPKDKHLYFNYKGNISREEWLESCGSLARAFEYEYDEGDNTLNYKLFDANNRLTRLNIYDHNGMITHVERYNPDGSVDSLFEFIYDDKNNTITERIYNHKGIVKTKYKGRYDNNGRLAESIWYECNHMIMKTIKVYDENHNMVEFQMYCPENKMERLELNLYDYEMNIVVRRIADFLLNQTSVFRYSYDDHKNITKVIRVHSLSRYNHVLQYEYVYDEHDNWIRRIQYKNNVPEFIHIRNIEYYD